MHSVVLSIIMVLVGAGRASSVANTIIDALQGFEGKYQVDQQYRRPEIVSAHSKWLYCTNAFESTTSQCTEQTFVPSGYFFETGRKLRRPLGSGETCNNITEADMYNVTTCEVKSGLTMVLPVVNTYYCAGECDDKYQNCEKEDPRIGPSTMWSVACKFKALTAMLDGKDVDLLDTPMIISQDGDYSFKAEMDPYLCPNRNTDFDICNGIPVGGAGPYVFIDTSKLEKGSHELILIGEHTENSCSAVKNIFTIV